MTTTLTQEDIQFFKSCAIAINSIGSQKEKTLWRTGAHAYSLYLLEKEGFDTSSLQADADHMAYLNTEEKIAPDEDCTLLVAHYQIIINGLKNPTVCDYMKKLLEKYKSL